ncbi:MAG: lytic transglycosylase domain-containing protein [Synergistaceae bacterium]|nr:lytic transglycosylase domain-containing protein [Synergistaceae bacterium]MBQ9404382.1 lytic transglycosylase domain-containing protein [Synergistaceae bacterium]MBQ9594369.1 lytic transglycosylase domain-containing protein [Synergistaceae bacterium]MBR0203328.1 lytic transglycosylase domain-containing protein [Synergistaceae bacterium]
MVGPNYTNITRVLSRIDEINRQMTPELYQPQPNPVKSRFVDVLNEVNDAKSRKIPGLKAASGKTNYTEMKDIIDSCAEKYNIDSELIRAMIQVESGWDTGAVSNKGAQGLMQLMPRTAAMLGVNDPFDPVQNIEGGVRYISDLTDKYRGDIEKALAAYNAGPTRVDSGNIPEVSRRYVKNIMAIYRKLREVG